MADDTLKTIQDFLKENNGDAIKALKQFIIYKRLKSKK
jgi:hypothetical protein